MRDSTKRRCDHKSGTVESGNEIITSVDLTKYPRIGEHFARIYGRAKSDKVIHDPKLLEDFGLIIRMMQDDIKVMSESDKLSYLRLRGFTSFEDFELSVSVVTDTNQWDRSRPDVSKLYSALEAYGEDNGGVTCPEAYSSALRDLTTWFGRSLEASALSNDLPIQGARSSGFPMMRKKEDDLERGLKSARKLVVTKRSPDPCVAVHRVQQKEGGAKTRLAFAYPIQMNLLEGMFAPQVISHIKDYVPPCTLR